MKTIKLTLFTFDELSETAKQKAIDNYRNKCYDYSFYYYEIINSAKAAAELFDFKFGREYTTIKNGHIDDCILNLSGVRLATYILNNYGYGLFKPSYIKTIHRAVNWPQFICKQYTTRDGQKYTQIFSHIRKNNDCTLTGMYCDVDILHPVYDFLKKPNKHTTFLDLIEDIENAIQKCFDNTEEWVNSDEFIADEMRANDFEFTENGEIY